MSGLKKALRMRSLVATSAGLALASSVYSVSIQAADAAGGLWVVAAIIVAGLINMLASRNFSELATMFPTVGGVHVFIRHAFGARLSTTVSLSYIVLAWCAGAAESYVFAKVIHYLTLYADLSFLAWVPETGWVVLTMGVFFLINLLGVELAGKVQERLTFLMFGLIVGMSVYGFTLHGGQPAVSWSQLTQWNGTFSFVTAVALSIYLYIGFEWVTPMVEEVEDTKFLVKAMPIAILLLMVVYSLMTVVMIWQVPIQQLMGTPVPHLEYAASAMGTAGVAVMGIISFFATITSFNAGMMGNSRMLYGLAREGVLPRVLSKVHPKLYTPWAALLFMFGMQLLISLVVVGTGSFTVPILLSAIIESVIYAMVAATVVKLRKTMPDHPRPYQASRSVWSQWMVIGLYSLLVVSLLLPPSPWYVGPLFLAGLLICYLYATVIEARNIR